MSSTFKTFERIHTALNYIKSGSVNSLPDGKTELSDGIYVNVFEYLTDFNDRFEAHKSYVDIHYILDGEEYIEVAPVEEMKVTQAYNQEKDCILGKANGKKYELHKGDFLITMPEEAHSPAHCINEPVKVRKAVLKVKV